MVGLKQIIALKLNGLVKLSEFSIQNFMKCATEIESLELNKVENVGDGLLGAISSGAVGKKLKYIGLNMIPRIKPDPLEEFRRANPNLIVRRFMYQTADVKDNGLRKPLRPKEGKKKKKKKKGKKKK